MNVDAAAASNVARTTVAPGAGRRHRDQTAASGTTRNGSAGIAYRGPGSSSSGVPDQPAHNTRYAAMTANPIVAWRRTAPPLVRASQMAAPSATSTTGLTYKSPRVPAKTALTLRQPGSE